MENKKRISFASESAVARNLILCFFAAIPKQ
jgi:hypothetical protein